LARIAVPDGSYKVEAFNTASQSFQTADFSHNCYADYNDLNQQINSCWLTINHTTAAFDITLLRISMISLNSPDTVQDLPVGASIESENIVLQFKDYNNNQSSLEFVVTDKKSGKDEVLTMNLGSWSSYLDFNEFNRFT